MSHYFSFFFLLFFIIIYYFFFLGPYPNCICICDLHHSSQQHRILNPLREARDQTHNLMGPSRICFRCAMMGTPWFTISIRYKMITPSPVTFCHQQSYPNIISIIIFPVLGITSPWFCFFFFLILFLFTAALVAYGNSQARGQMGVAAEAYATA